MVKCIGLTGGIGSGKSTVAKLFELLGVPVYCADVEGRRLTNEDQRIVLALKEMFGSGVYVNGELNRDLVASRVFSNRELLNELNGIIHPVVKEDFEKWRGKHSNHKFVVQEAAILFENGSYKRFDEVVLVTAPEKVRLERVMKRDKVTEVQVRSRMSNQWDDEKKMPLADYVVVCDDTMSVIEQVLNIIDKV